jgi:hypothetical protein
MAVNDNNTTGSAARECKLLQARLRYLAPNGNYYTVFGAQTNGISDAQGPAGSGYDYGHSRSLDYGAGAWGGWQWH